MISKYTVKVEGIWVVSYLLLVCSPSDAWLSNNRFNHLCHGRTIDVYTGTSTVALGLSSDGEMDEETMIEGDEAFTFSPTTERESYTSEAEVAQQANELAAASAHVELQSEISNSFLQYALSIILGRAIPDARDGLKPVHRRILYAMDQLNLRPSSAHRKCARVVGEVLGKFHPHGDVAVYDALVRLAQTFSTHYTLVDGHGNFGSIDADPAAAMRYTEARLTALSREALLDELAEDTVDFLPNFDGNEQEPSVLPAKLPVLLLNGASGIAVGMATNIPPHNLNEIMSACQALIDERVVGTAASDEELLKLVPGPDFPTGATILGTAGARQLYKTSNGGVTMRATTHVEQLTTKKKATRTAIVVTELPYQVNKAALLEKTAALVNDKKLEGVADLRDESDRDGIRVVIELKRDAVPAIVLNNLYKKTALQTTFSGNFLALFSGSSNDKSLVPKRFTLREALDEFIDFRFSTLRRKAQFQLRKVEARAAIVDGLLIALKNVDWIIEAVKKAKDLDAARAKVEAHLETTSAQTEAILKLQLGQLTRLNKGKLTGEKKELNKSKKELDALLRSDSVVYNSMKEEFTQLTEKFGSPRKTKILEEEDGDIEDIDLVTNSRSVIVVTRGGYIKRMPLKTFESQSRGTRGKRGTSASGNSDEGEVAHCFTCNDHDTVLMVSQRGIAYGVKAFKIPIATRTAKGQPIPSVLPIRSDESVTAVLPVSDFLEDEYIVLTTEQGYVKKTALAAFKKLTTRGLIIASLNENDSLLTCQHCRDGDDILVGTSSGKGVRFESSKLRPTGRASRGVRAIRMKEGDSIAGVDVISGSDTDVAETEFVLAVTSNGFGKRISQSEFRSQTRGGSGVIVIKFKDNQDEDSVQCLLTVKEDDEVLFITARGVMVRQKASNIPTQRRGATGVTIQKLDESDHIVSVSLVPKVNEKA